eukprot:scaffold25421_cov71-Phaeocystis_antarctica.AAC.2
MYGKYLQLGTCAKRPTGHNAGQGRCRHGGHANVEGRPWCEVGGYDFGVAVALWVGNVDLLPGQHRVAVERPRHLQHLELRKLNLQQ